ncbi:MAG: 50S ribosomal protein L29 [Desulfovibrio sp.]|nr:50S ribosomal protein L29 [Desulfovibrio sp.]
MATNDKQKATFPSAKELRDLSVEDLNSKLREERDALVKDRMEIATARLEKTSLLKTRRRQIARIQTILTEKQQRA